MGQHRKHRRRIPAAASIGITTVAAAGAAIGVTALPASAAVTPVAPEQMADHVRTVTAPAPAIPTVTVRAGDTLSGLAQQYCGSAGKWPNLFGGNSATVKNPNIIYVGQVIKLACKAVARYFTPPPAGPPVTVTAAAPVVTVTGASGGTGPVDAAGVAAAYAAFAGASCIVTRESGGDPTIVNTASGAAGLYQDLPSTWNGYDGYASAADAPVSVQIEFNVALSGDGTNLSPWAADGCPGT